MNSRYLSLVLIVLLGLTELTWAQGRPGGRPAGAAMPQGSISGIVMDADTNDPLIAATVSVWQVQDSSLVTGTITDAKGKFTIEGLRPGAYYVQASFVGFMTETIADIALGRDGMQADLGTISLASDAALMDEVRVEAEREIMEVAIDRTIYNVKDQPTLVGASATEALQNIPSVEVDQEGKVSLRGSENVAILLNGRPVQMSGEILASFLQSLPASGIERIEVMPNPSAKYEPDGMSGILNIVLKRDADLGVSGAVSAGLGTDGDYNASGNVALGRGPLNLRVNYGFRYDRRDVSGTTFRENRFLDPLTFLDQDSDTERDGNSHVVGANLDYRLTKKNTVSLSGLVSTRGGDNDGLNAFSIFDATQVLDSRFDRFSLQDGSNFRMDYSAAFSRVMTPGKHELTAEVRWNQRDDDDDRTYVEQLLTADEDPLNDTPERQNVETDERNRSFDSQVDYTRAIGETGRLETGAKVTVRSLENDLFSALYDYTLNVFEAQTNLNNEFVYDEQVYAAYGIYGQEFGKFGAQVGLRLEQAVTTFDLLTTDEAFDNNYFSVFPNAYLTYSPKQGRTFKASYSKRINRPRTRQLNPFDDLSDPTFRRIGNPFLSPEYVHSYELSYTQFTKWGTITAAPYFRRTVDVIRRYQTLESDGVTQMTFENLATNDSYGAELTASYRIGSMLSGFGNVNAYRIVTDGSNLDTDLSNNALGWSTRLNTQLRLPRNLSVQFTWFYRSPIDIEGGRIQSFQFSNLAVSQRFLNNRATLSLGINDVFDASGFELYREDDLFYQELSRRWDGRRGTLTFTYNFGKQDRNFRRGDRNRGGEGGDFDPEGMM